MKKRLTIIALLFLGAMLQAKAQDQGCVFNNVILTDVIGSYNGQPLFRSNECGGASIPKSSPLWHETGKNGTCYIDFCSTNPKSYKKSKVGIVDTPLDDYALVITFGVAGLAFFSIRRREYRADRLSMPH